MKEIVGPTGFRNIEDAPRDGSFVRLRFRPSVWMSDDHEVQARWVADAGMRADGWWCDRQGYYVTPGPLFWAPISPLMEQAAQAAEKIKGWSAAKKAWAKRVVQ